MATEDKSKNDGGKKDDKGGDKPDRRVVRDPSTGNLYYLNDDGSLAPCDKDLEQMSDLVAQKVIAALDARESGADKKKKAGSNEDRGGGSGDGGSGSSLRDRLFKKKS